MIDSAPTDERACGDADVAGMRAVLRTARTAPWVALAGVDAAAAGSVARLRGRCARLAAGAAAGVAHRACPPSVLRSRSADMSGDAGGVVDARGSAGWQARSLDLGGLAVAAHRLRRNAEHPDWETRSAALSSSALPTVMLWPAVFDDDIGVNIAAVSNPACPHGLLRIAATLPRLLLETALAANPALPSDLFESLISRHVPAGFGHPQRQPPRRQGSGMDAGPRPRRGQRSGARPAVPALLAAALHPNCPNVLMEALSGHDHPQIRQAVAANPACPDDLRRRLRFDDDRDVAAAARAADPSLVPRLADTQTSQDMCVIAAATNLNCDAGLLAKIAQTMTRDYPRQLIAAHPSCPTELRAELAWDSHPHVAAAAAAATPGSDPRRLARLAANNDPVLRTAVAANPSCPPDVLDRLTRDTHPRVAAAAAANPSPNPAVTNPRS